MCQQFYDNLLDETKMSIEKLLTFSNILLSFVSIYTKYYWILECLDNDVLDNVYNKYHIMYKKITKIFKVCLFECHLKHALSLKFEEWCTLKKKLCFGLLII